MNKPIKLQLPAPHPAQLQVIQNAKRFNVVCCGRRWGKTVLGMNRLILPALQGKPVAWFAPNYRLISEVWRKLQNILQPVLARVNQQDRRLELHGGGVIEMWSLDSPDSGRGRAYAVIIIDECALVPNLQMAWQQTIRPMLTDFIGEAWFLSTPKGMNHFKTLYDRGQDPQCAEWASWQMPTIANPYRDPSEIASAQMDMTENAFNQEYRALFVNWEDSVFRRVIEAATAPYPNEPEAGHQYVIGCDWGRTKDYTVFVVLDQTTRTIVEFERSNRVDYTMQCERLKALSERWQPVQIIVELNSIGQPIIEQLAREGLRVYPFTTTNTSKKLAIEALALAFERGDIRIPNDPVIVSELLAYEGEKLPSGLLRYGAPAGQHDDVVMALAIAWSSVAGQGRRVYPISDAEIVVKDFTIPEHWPRAYGLDVRWNTVGAIWGALDRQTDVLYLYGEYLAESDSAIHAAALKSRGEWIKGLIDPRGNGRVEADGYRLLEHYRKLGLRLETIENSVESGILDVWQRMHSERLKVFGSLTKYLEERRLYHRDERDQIVSCDDNLQDATRCLVSGIARMCTKPVPPRYFPPRVIPGDRSWMY